MEFTQELQILAGLGVKGAFLSVEKLSDFLGGSPSPLTIYRWGRKGLIPLRDHNGIKVAYIPEILEWSANRRIEADQNSAPKRASVSKFRQVQGKLRSLTTEVTAQPLNGGNYGNR